LLGVRGRARLPASEGLLRRSARDRSKLRDCDVVALKVEDVASNGRAVDSGNRPAKENAAAVRFELTEQTRQAVDDCRIATGNKQANFNGAWPRDSTTVMAARMSAIGPISDISGPRFLRRKSALSLISLFENPSCSQPIPDRCYRLPVNTNRVPTAE
jgi:hypothetical protein